MPEPASPEEVMTINAARGLRDGEVCLVGVGPPNAAVNLARRLHAPDCVLVYESGAIGSKPARLPLSIGDDDLAETADAIVSVPEMFNYWIGGGRIDVGFLGAAQIDRQGQINTTVIGDYGTPKVRMPGAGGAPEIASSARRVMALLRQSPRTFVAQLDFTTSTTDPPGPDARPMQVITDLGILERDAGDGELVLTALHGETTVEEAVEATGWELRAVAEPQRTPAPTDEELETLRVLRAR